MVDTGDGNLVYWEACGNPRGIPALMVHGGPGSGCSAGHTGSTAMEQALDAAADRMFTTISGQAPGT